ncbi:aldo/keto reductase [Treponema zuelzerae]|uniref:Aldo/keto reductase n=1 Tax=Teretinema zuelzerae TaxID=156 RepID=A0AAE3EKG2_9SPIR|nr:aldo/keto reductase [Teretinema zuelzerae]MCD1655129.1 aldo/keto reductase [Teretinema zuelzerae]
MKYRNLGKTGFKVSEISLGTWQLGGGWGKPYDEKTAEAVLETALEQGITFFDTADVYSDGKSEASVGSFVRRHRDSVRFATKCGRRLNPHTDQSYTPASLRSFVEDSLRNTGLERLDLIQLHCPPTSVYYRPEIFEEFERLRDEGKIDRFGVSVEKAEEGLKAIEYPNVDTVQIIFNIFRQRPAELFFREAAAKNIGVIVRVPLASGLLAGKMTEATVFEAGDHRTFNRNGESFDKGETFSGVPLPDGLRAVERLREIFPPEPSMAVRSLRWILDHPEVSCVIPGASRPDQIPRNCAASEAEHLPQAEHTQIRRIYEVDIKPLVHQRW